MKTALYERHKGLNAKIVDFGGWEMPLQYKGALLEQRAVRTAVGIFDVSHMGRIIIQGPEAEKLLEYLSTNRISNRPDFSATYTAWCDLLGGCVDDLIVYRYNSQKFFIIVNAANREKDLNHLKKYAEKFHVEIIDLYKEDGILAIQGPNAIPLVEQLFPSVKKLPSMYFMEAKFNNETVIIASTGYTGAGGVEIYAKDTAILQLWDQFLTLGKPYGIEPAGLAARDILRLEMGYVLYGHEINDTIAPIESVAAWAVKMDKPEFIGKSALLKLADCPKLRFEQGLMLVDPGIAREGYPIFKDGLNVGKVTSGGHSPTLNKSIAIALLNQKYPIGEQLEVAIRQNLCKATIVSLPFINMKT